MKEGKVRWHKNLGHLCTLPSKTYASGSGTPVIKFKAQTTIKCFLGSHLVGLVQNRLPWPLSDTFESQIHGPCSKPFQYSLERKKTLLNCRCLDFFLLIGRNSHAKKILQGTLMHQRDGNRNALDEDEMEITQASLECFRESP